ncbi:hypothetical protein [Ornithinimicrobium kibberense]
MPHPLPIIVPLLPVAVVGSRPVGHPATIVPIMPRSSWSRMWQW